MFAGLLITYCTLSTVFLPRLCLFKVLQNLILDQPL
jgi:hypothetical protein